MQFPRTPEQHRRIALRTEVIGVQAATEYALALMRAREFEAAVAALGEAKVLVRRAERGDRSVGGLCGSEQS